jgi:1,2-dihydroxy-3-keto-5-methylthiopentene dioxygenase
MAKLTPLWTGTEENDPSKIAVFLTERGISYEHWPLTSEVEELANNDRLSDAEKERILAIYGNHLEKASITNGYGNADIIAVRPSIPGVDDALAKFDRVHYHDDDEVRAVVGGRGVFGLIDDEGRQFLLQVAAGDTISVPAGMWHWFYCLEDRNITCIRLFQDTAGWEPHYRPTERGTCVATS